MQLNASTEYGVRAILYLALKGTTCSSRDIAEEMSIPRDYLIQIAQQLRNSGLIEARPGKNGGYRLAKDPADISLLEIIEALRETGRADKCGRTKASNGSVQKAYELVLESYDLYLDSINVLTLMKCAQSASTSREMLAARLADEGRRLAVECARSA